MKFNIHHMRDCGIHVHADDDNITIAVSTPINENSYAALLKIAKAATNDSPFAEVAVTAFCKEAEKALILSFAE